MERLQGNKAKRKRRYPTPQKKVEQSKGDELQALMRMSSGAQNKGIRMAIALPEGRSGADGDGLGKRERKTWGANRRG